MTRAVQVTSATPGRVPSSATAVALDVTLVAPTASTYITVWPQGQARPTTSFLNAPVGSMVSNSGVIPLGPTGKIELYNYSGSSHFVIDVQGYFTGAGALPGGAGEFHAIHPTRVLDTRDSTGGHPFKLAPQETHTFSVSDAVVPESGVQAVVMNLTTIAPANGGFLTAWAAGSPRPGVSAFDFSAGQTVSGAAIVRVSAASTVSIYNGTPGEMHVTADVQGWFSAGTSIGSGGFFTPVGPERIVDTRSGLGGVTQIPPSEVVAFSAVGVAGIPTTNVDSVAVNVTVVNAAAGGYVTAWQDLTEQPRVSTMNFTTGPSRANMSALRVSSEGGGLALFNGTAQPLHVVVDVYGWFHTNESDDPACGFDRVCHDSIGSVSTPEHEGELRSIPRLAFSDDQSLTLPGSEATLPRPTDTFPPPQELTPPPTTADGSYPDDYRSRFNVEEPYWQPAMRSVHLLVWWHDTPADRPSRCSGYMYSPNMVGTAGHCIYDKDHRRYYPKKIQVDVAAWHHVASGESRSTFAECWSNQAFAPRGWREHEDLIFDFGAVRVECPGEYGNRIGQYSGYYSVSSNYQNALEGRVVGIYGYPGLPLYQRWFALLHGDGTVYNTGKYKSRFYFRIKTARGDSGSPIFLRDNPGRWIVVGNDSYGKPRRDGAIESVARRMTAYSVDELRKWSQCHCGATS